MAITRRFMVGQKSTTLATSKIVFREGQYWAEWVWEEERDRRKARALIPPAYAEFKRLMASIRSSGP